MRCLSITVLTWQSLGKHYISTRYFVDVYNCFCWISWTLDFVVVFAPKWLNRPKTGVLQGTEKCLRWTVGCFYGAKDKNNSNLWYIQGGCGGVVPELDEFPFLWDFIGFFWRDLKIAWNVGLGERLCRCWRGYEAPSWIESIQGLRGDRDIKLSLLASHPLSLV